MVRFKNKNNGLTYIVRKPEVIEQYEKLVGIWEKVEDKVEPKVEIQEKTKKTKKGK